VRAGRTAQLRHFVHVFFKYSGISACRLKTDKNHAFRRRGIFYFKHKSNQSLLKKLT
jgi:hypothetical protein